MTTAILEFRRPGISAASVCQNARTDFARVFALDRIPAAPRRLVCHWRRGADGRLAAAWVQDVIAKGDR